MADTLSSLKRHVESMIKENGENHPIVYDIFTADDVRAMAEERSKPLITDEEIEKILTKVERNKDANIGLNWVSIETAMTEVLDYP